MTDDDERLDDLDDLIRYLEKEKERLKKRVDEAAQEWEFSEAKAFAKAYRNIEIRLRALKSFRDPSFDERARLYQRMAFLEEEMKTHTNAPQWARIFSEELKEINQALDKIEKARHSPIDTQHLDHAIYQLVDGTIENFKLHISKSEKVVFDFTCGDKLLRIELSYKKGALFPGMKKRLRKIGFVNVEGTRTYCRSIHVSSFKDVQKIKQLLAVVVFDVFGGSWVDNPAQLEINHKADPRRSEGEDRSK